MRIIKCDRGHYYDADSYDDCPHCNKNISIKPPKDNDKGNKREVSVALIVNPVVKIRYITVLSTSTFNDNSINKESVLFNGEISKLPESINLIKKGYQIKLYIHVFECISPNPVIEYRSLDYSVVSGTNNELKKLFLTDLNGSIDFNTYVYMSDKPIDLTKINKKTISVL